MLAVLLLAGCSTPQAPKPGPALPLYVGNGAGSAKGNYAGQEDGEFRNEKGLRCVAYNWDRPLTADLAIRYRSACCRMNAQSEFMVCHEISRTTLPIAQSNLAEER